MTEQQLEDLTIDYLLSRNPYANIKKAWLDYDEYGFKAWYENADGEQNGSWLATHNKEEAVQKMKRSV